MASHNIDISFFVDISLKMAETCLPHIAYHCT